MDLELPPRHVAFRDSVREIAQAVALPLAAEVDRDHRFPEEAVSAASEAGLLGVLIPREFGGAGLDALAFTLCIDELAQACASTSVIVDVHTSVGSEPILLFGTQEQKRKWLPRLASGELLGAFALTEPAAGSDAASLKTSARRNDDGYILNGTKVFITNIGRAGLYIVFARTGPSERASGVSAFIVPADTPGVRAGLAADRRGGGCGVGQPIRTPRSRRQSAADLRGFQPGPTNRDRPRNDPIAARWTSISPKSRSRSGTRFGSWCRIRSPHAPPRSTRRPSIRRILKGSSPRTGSSAFPSQ